MQIKTNAGLDLQVNGLAFATAALFARKKHGNYISSLCGVRVEPLSDGGALLIATDGHKLAVYRDATATAERPVTLGVCKAVTGKESLYSCQEIVREYPDWRQAIPSALARIKPVSLAWLDGESLGTFANAAKKMGASVTLDIQACDDRGIYIVGFGNPDFHGVLIEKYPRKTVSDLRPAFIDAAPRLVEAAQ